MAQIPIEEYRRRSQKLNNYEKVMYPQLKERSDRLRQKNKQLKEENEQLKKENREQEKELEKLRLELEELRNAKFGKKRQTGKKEKVSLPGKDSKKDETSSKKRPVESYRKEVPPEEEITGEIELAIDTCPKCGTELTKKQEYVYYREDLEILDILIKQAKTITKRIIESGYCPNCKTRRSGAIIPKQKVEIGINVKMMIVYCCIILGLSHEETRNHMKINYNIQVSDGQITNSLEEQADILKPYYQQILDELEKEKGAHYDETSWQVQKEEEGNYAWVKTGTESNKTVFWFGKSRGKGVVEKLRGDISKESVRNQVGISDDYASYRNILENHQLCWAHPHRKLRDLAESSQLSEIKRKYCQSVYEDFAKLYKEAEEAKEKFNKGNLKNEEKNKEEQRLKNWMKKITEANDKDSDKLVNIKKSLAERLDRYFTFLKVLNIPLDNNKAERSLRKVVLKRKKSFGCKTQKGANVLSILYTVCFTILWENSPEEFLKKYQEVIGI